MKILINILLVISILLLLFSCFIGVIYYGSGHIIPIPTGKKYYFLLLFSPLSRHL